MRLQFGRRWHERVTLPLYRFTDTDTSTALVSHYSLLSQACAAADAICEEDETAALCVFSSTSHEVVWENAAYKARLRDIIKLMEQK